MCCLLLDLLARFLAVTGGVLEATDDPEDPEPLGLGPDVLTDLKTGAEVVHVIAGSPSDRFNHHQSKFFDRLNESSRLGSAGLHHPHSCLDQR
jgi:hypothetical protein